MQAIYKIEAELRERKLTGEAKQTHRLTHSKPRVEAFFEWVGQQLAQQGFTPSNPFIKALNYVRERRLGLEVFLTDPDVPLDTNHLERALRVIPMGRKSWLFCWTELGAKHVGIIQSLIVTCRLHGIDPYTYLVDVLQRVGQHPAARVWLSSPLGYGRFTSPITRCARIYTACPPKQVRRSVTFNYPQFYELDKRVINMSCKYF